MIKSIGVEVRREGERAVVAVRAEDGGCQGVWLLDGGC